MTYKVGMVSLGCPKNQVDGEMLLARLRQDGFEITADETAADVIIVNTCGFIEDAKREAIDNILEVAQQKQTGRLKALVVTGCLAQRYQDEILKEARGRRGGGHRRQSGDLRGCAPGAVWSRSSKQICTGGGYAAERRATVDDAGLFRLSADCRWL